MNGGRLSLVPWVYVKHFSYGMGMRLNMERRQAMILWFRGESDDRWSEGLKG